MSEQTGRTARRFLRLIEELRDELDSAWGWQGKVAAMLGVDTSYISRLAGKQRASVGLDAVEHAIRVMRIRPEYFFGDPEPRSYRYYVGSRYPAFDVFCRGEHGRTMTSTERAQLASVLWQDEEPDVASYDALLYSLRGSAPGRTTEVEAFNRGIDAQMREETKRLPPPKG